MEKRELQFDDGKSRKFWTIVLNGASHTVTFGRIGTNGQTRTKDFDTEQDARKSYDKLVAQKLGKGYVEQDSTPEPKKAAKPNKGIAKGKKSISKAMQIPCLSAESEARVRNLVSKYELEEAYDLIASAAVECVTLFRGAEIKRATVGSSRFGGTPDLADKEQWPRDELYSGFFMQLNLADIPSIAENPLPASGLLSFFVHDDYDVKDSSVLHFPNVDDLRKIKKPAEEEFACPDLFYDSTPHHVEFEAAIDMPGYGSDFFWEVTEAAGDKKAGDRYLDLASELQHGSNAKRVIGQLLGYHSDLIENMREAAVDHDPRKSTVDNWRLLWRIDSNFEVGLVVGDMGNFFVLIHEDDLGQPDFEKTHTVLET